MRLFAARASLAPATVYAGAGGKAAVLATLIDEVMRDPIVEETLSAVRGSRSGYEVPGVASTACGWTTSAITTSSR